MLLKGGGFRAGLSTERVLGIISFSRSPVLRSYGAMLIPLVAAQHLPKFWWYATPLLIKVGTPL